MSPETCGTRMAKTPVNGGMLSRPTYASAVSKPELVPEFVELEPRYATSQALLVGSRLLPESQQGHSREHHFATSFLFLVFSMYAYFNLPRIRGVLRPARYSQTG